MKCYLRLFALVRMQLTPTPSALAFSNKRAGNADHAARAKGRCRAANRVQQHSRNVRLSSQKGSSHLARQALWRCETNHSASRNGLFGKATWAVSQTRTDKIMEWREKCDALENKVKDIATNYSFIGASNCLLLTVDEEELAKLPKRRAGGLQTVAQCYL